MITKTILRSILGNERCNLAPRLYSGVFLYVRGIDRRERDDNQVQVRAASDVRRKRFLIMGKHW